MSETFVSVEWLAINLDRVVPVEASFYLPDEGVDADVLFAQGHIPGAVRFDIDAIAAPGSTLPHMLPDGETFARLVGALGVSEHDALIVYDATDLLGGARAWWMLRHFGARDVRLLSGGLKAWIAAGGALEGGTSKRPASTFRPRADPDGTIEAAGVLDAVGDGSVQVVDARSAARFAGSVAEPRPGLRAGHIPRSRNLPWRALIDDAGKMHGAPQLSRLFAAAGIDIRRPVVASCGSGVSAAVLLLGLHVLARCGEPVDGSRRLYDGSWAEWGSRPDLPAETGSPS